MKRNLIFQRNCKPQVKVRCCTVYTKHPIERSAIAGTACTFSERHAAVVHNCSSSCTRMQRFQTPQSRIVSNRSGHTLTYGQCTAGCYQKQHQQGRRIHLDRMLSSKMARKGSSVEEWRAAVSEALKRTLLAELRNPATASWPNIRTASDNLGPFPISNSFHLTANGRSAFTLRSPKRARKTDYRRFRPLFTD